MANYPSTSPYATTYQNSWYIDLYKHRPVPAHNADRVITIAEKYNRRPDLLSYDLYGSPQYWWVFLVRNMNVIRDPVWDFETGKKIFVPSVDHLRSVVG
jgi:hypothetical protein